MSTKKTAAAAAEAAAEEKAENTAKKAAEAAEDTAKREKAESTETEKKTKAETQEAPAARVYCGPSIKGVSRQYVVYTAGLPEALTEFLEAHPVAKSLLVPVERFAVTRKKLETAGTPEAIIFQKLMSEL